MSLFPSSPSRSLPQRLRTTSPSASAPARSGGRPLCPGPGKTAGGYTAPGVWQCAGCGSLWEQVRDRRPGYTAGEYREQPRPS